MDLLTDLFGLKIESEKWNKQNALPLYIKNCYEFTAATINGCKCIVLTPTEEFATLPALKKQIKKIQEIENVPVALKLSTISFFRKKNLIENGIPFITGKQVFLPFLGTVLSDEDEEIQEITKFMFSTQQLVLLFLYDNKEKLYCSEVIDKLPFTSMTISRAVKQLEAVGLFHITKDGVNKVIESKYSRAELYERINGYLSSPVRKVGYIKKANITDDMVVAGETALSEYTMLNPSKVMTYAVLAKSFDKSLLMKELVDPKQQVKVELWEYEPKLFANNGVADKISVALSFKDNTDERIEEAVDELLNGVWNS